MKKTGKSPIFPSFCIHVVQKRHFFVFCVYTQKRVNTRRKDNRRKQKGQQKEPQTEQQKGGLLGQDAFFYWMFFCKSSSARTALAFGAGVVNGQLIILNFGTDLALQGIGQRVELDVGDLTAFVAKQVVVRLNDFIKAVGNTVDVQALNKTCLVHCVEVVINGRHGDGRHFQLCQKENFVSRQMAVGLL